MPQVGYAQLGHLKKWARAGGKTWSLLLQLALCFSWWRRGEIKPPPPPPLFGALEGLPASRLSAAGLLLVAEGQFAPPFVWLDKRLAD